MATLEELMRPSCCKRLGAIFLPVRKLLLPRGGYGIWSTSNEFGVEALMDRIAAVTRSEIITVLNKTEAFILAIVQVATALRRSLVISGNFFRNSRTSPRPR